MSDESTKVKRSPKSPYPHQEPLQEVPPDFNPSKHAPLKKSDFAHEKTYFTMKAEEFEAKAARMRRAAQDSEKYGNADVRKKKRRFDRLAETLAELKAQLLSEDNLSESDLAESIKSLIR